ncbi:class II fumarate hydratase [soil metagenome]
MSNDTSPDQILSTSPATRIARDSLGEMEVPADVHYGASTMRASINFPISGIRFPRRFIQALGQIKGAAARVNADLDLLDSALADAIQQAAREVAEGSLDDQFILDIFQTGSGTSTNTNANEVIASRANEILGHARGLASPVHPNDHVNMGQSSNDVIPSAMHLAALSAIHEDLLPAIHHIENSLNAKADELMPVIKTGRTHLQDATPIRLGQEFLGYASQFELSRRRLRSAVEDLREIALGGTAVGTGINTHPEFSSRVCELLSECNGFAVVESPHHFQAQGAIDAVVFASGTLKAIGVSITKIANDIRWLGSGPRAGLGEIELPAVQPGSSIMPGKINPVIAESAAMVAAQVIGNDATITIAGTSGNFELNVMLPVAAFNLLQSIELLSTTCFNLTDRCIVGIKATDQGPNMVERGLMIGTALAPVIGYDAAADIAKTAAAIGRTIREVAREKTDLTDEQLDEILDPAQMTQPS